jgi:hypothetical protein
LLLTREGTLLIYDMQYSECRPYGVVAMFDWWKIGGTISAIFIFLVLKGCSRNKKLLVQSFIAILVLTAFGAPKQALQQFKCNTRIIS